SPLRRVFEALAAGDSRPAVDLMPWVAVQVWLEGAEHRVVVPFPALLDGGGCTAARAPGYRRAVEIALRAGSSPSRSWVCSLIPCCRQSSTTVPPSPSRRTCTIRSGVN